MDRIVGFSFLAVYIVFVGVASFWQKAAMKELNPYQINVLMALGMLVTAVPAMWWYQGDLRIPIKSLWQGVPIGLLMALGSIAYVLALAKLPAGLTAALSISYVVLVVLLSRLFLGEMLDAAKILGIVLVMIGAGLLSWRSS